MPEPKKGGVFLLSLGLCLTLNSSPPPSRASRSSSPLQVPLQHEVSVINISVPVRVYDGARFVDSLKLEDFEVYEDGKAQEVQAAYYIQKNDVTRREAPPRSPAPAATRHFVLSFEMYEYLPEVQDAVDFFFDNVYLRGDTLDVVTIRATYRLREDISTKALREKTKTEIKSKIRKDTVMGGSEINAVVREMVENLEHGDLGKYESNFHKLEAMRSFEEKKLIAFAGDLRQRPGAKHVFLFFQREMVPQYSDKVLSEKLSDSSTENQGTQDILRSLMTNYRRDISIDRNMIEKAFSDASIDVHFLYVTKAAVGFRLDGTYQEATDLTIMKEHSEDIYNAFREIAAATGGISDTSANMAALMKTAVDASERYYLLYYRPRDYVEDGRFHAIAVKVKGRAYRVSHRAGYFAKDVPALPSLPPEPEKPVVKAEAEPRKPLEAAQAAELNATLQKTAAYCRKLESAALNLVCLEQVREQGYWEAHRASTSQIGHETLETRGGRIIELGPGRDSNEWTYDYQLIHQGPEIKEKRTLLKENGKDVVLENAELRTHRFGHKNLVTSPATLLGESAQRIHAYSVGKEENVDDERALVVDIEPLAKTESGNFGKAWVRERDGAILRIEWAPSSLGNYENIERFSREIGCPPRITLSAEFKFEKNGLRFPSKYEATEAYAGLITTKGNILSRTAVTYSDYKFFRVETDVNIK